MKMNVPSLVILVIVLSLALASCASQQCKEGKVVPSSAHNDLVTALKDEIKNDQVVVDEYCDVMTVNVVDRLFFDFGKANIKPEAYPLLNKIGKILKDIPGNKIIQVIGHTDDVPIRADYKWEFPNNWSLGARRAINVVVYLQEKAGISPQKMSVVSFSYFKPRVPNTSDSNRAKNRRIEIIVLNKNVYP